MAKFSKHQLSVIKRLKTEPAIAKRTMKLGDGSYLGLGCFRWSDGTAVGLSTITSLIRCKQAIKDVSDPSCIKIIANPGTHPFFDSIKTIAESNPQKTCTQCGGSGGDRWLSCRVCGGTGSL